MRILHLSDTHLGAVWPFDGAPPGWCRAADHEDALAQALLPALREEVDLVIHSGDLFDRSRPPPSAVDAAARLLGQAARRVPVIVMPGNHDRHGLRATFEAAQGVDLSGGLQIHDTPARVTVGEVAIGLVPYVSEAVRFAVGAVAAVGGGVDLLVAHQSFHGARVPGFTFRVGKSAETVGEAHLPASVRQVMCGHIHPRQVLRVGGARVVVVGSTERTAFSEVGQQKGAAIWEAQDGGWRVRPLDLLSRPMVVLRGVEDLARVVPGALVRSPVGLEREVRARGGYTAQVRRQLSLFTAAPRPRV